MDLSKITSAPWLVVDRMHEDAEPGEAFVQFGGTTDLTTDSTMMDRDHAEFIALARNAFDIQIRRGWFAVRFPSGWCACESAHYVDDNACDAILWAGQRAGKAAPVTPTTDPFACLVEADAWMKANE